jgi:hypothetical protein
MLVVGKMRCCVSLHKMCIIRPVSTAGGVRSVERDGWNAVGDVIVDGVFTARADQTDFLLPDRLPPTRSPATDGSGGCDEKVTT